MNRLQIQLHKSKHTLPGCPTAFNRTMSCLLFGQCKWTSESTVSLLNVGLSISSVTSSMMYWWEAHLQYPKSPMKWWHKVIQYSSVIRHQVSFAEQHNLMTVSEKTSGKMWSCKLHHAPIRQQVGHQDIQPKTKHSF